MFKLIIFITELSSNSNLSSFAKYIHEPKCSEQLCLSYGQFEKSVWQRLVNTRTDRHDTVPLYLTWHV